MKNHFIPELMRIAPAISLAAFLSSGCSTAPRVQTNYDPTTDFAACKTFAILTTSGGNSARNPELASIAEEAARQALLAKGFVERSTNAADVTFALRGKSLRRVEQSGGDDFEPVSLDAGTGWKHYESRRPPEPRTVYDRTLFIEGYDKKSNQIWVGWLEASGNSRIDPKRLEESVRTILEKFPPAK